MKLFNISNASSYKKNFFILLKKNLEKVPTTVATDKGLDYHLYINLYQ